MAQFGDEMIRLVSQEDEGVDKEEDALIDGGGDDDEDELGSNPEDM